MTTKRTRKPKRYATAAVLTVNQPRMNSSRPLWRDACWPDPCRGHSVGEVTRVATGPNVRSCGCGPKDGCKECCSGAPVVPGGAAERVLQKYLNKSGSPICTNYEQDNRYDVPGWCVHCNQRDFLHDLAAMPPRGAEPQEDVLWSVGCNQLTPGDVRGRGNLRPVTDSAPSGQAGLSPSVPNGGDSGQLAAAPLGATEPPASKPQDVGTCSRHSYSFAEYETSCPYCVAAAAVAPLGATEPQEDAPRPSKCSGCGGEYRYDVSIASTVWNRVIRAKGLPEYLCAACIIAEFVKANEPFSAWLSGDGISDRIHVEVNGKLAAPVPPRGAEPQAKTSRGHETWCATERSINSGPVCDCKPKTAPSKD